MKKILGWLIIFCMVIASMLLQSNVLNKIEIFGVRPNVLLVIVVTISLWYGLHIGTIFSMFLGIVADSWFNLQVGKYLIMFTFIAVMVGYYNKNYKKENIITLIYLVFNATIVYEILQGILNVIVIKQMFNLFVLLKVLVISIIFNVILASVMYYVIAYICNKVEDLIAEDRW